MDVFWKFMRSSEAQHTNPAGWLYRAGIRKASTNSGVNSAGKSMTVSCVFRIAPSPEQLHSAAEDQRQVRTVLATLKHRDSELLILRSEGLSYEETAEILGLREISIGTLLRRAQDAFRKEYVKRYGQPRL